jgi:hypothetical protein
MAKQRTYHGAYSRDDLGNHGGSPLKVVEMEKNRTRPVTVADGVSWADVVDRNNGPESNCGLASSVKRPKR